MFSNNIEMILITLAFFVFLALSVHVKHRKQRAEIEFQKQQRTSDIKDSTLYNLRHGFTGLENNFGLLTTDDKGVDLDSIVDRKKAGGLLYFYIFYFRKPELPNLERNVCRQLRGMLNGKLQNQRLTYENITPLYVYVTDVNTENGKLKITVIPLVDFKAVATMRAHKRWVAKRAAVGETGQAATGAKNQEVLTDDEL